MKEFISPKEASELLQIGTGALRYWLQIGKIKKVSYTSKGQARYFREEIEKLAHPAIVKHYHDTYAEKLEAKLIAKKEKASAHNTTRSNARKLYEESGQPKVCKNCGYDKHVQICHRKAVAKYPIATMVHDANRLNNLIALCPNCHWEFDHGLLDL